MIKKKLNNCMKNESMTISKAFIKPGSLFVDMKILEKIYPVGNCFRTPKHVS